MNLLSVPSALARESDDPAEMTRIMQAYEEGRQGKPLSDNLLINQHLLDEIHNYGDAIARLDTKRRKLKAGITGTDRGQITAIAASIMAIAAQLLSGIGDVIDEIADTRRSRVFGIVALSLAVVAFTAWAGSIFAWYRYSRAQQAKAELGPVSSERAEDRHHYRRFLTAVTNFLKKAPDEPLEATRHRLQVVVARYRKLTPKVRESIPALPYWMGRLLEALPDNHPFKELLHESCESTLGQNPSFSLYASMDHENLDPTFEQACYHYPLDGVKTLNNEHEGLGSLLRFKEFETKIGCSLPEVDIGPIRFSRWATVSPVTPSWPPIEIVVD